ncbi:GFA family protein [Pseudomonas sp.]|uniref:GFA family protein n=1 Tax=Pseudomonas sp. TaxID=306 RepID=UPI0028A8BF03|nr:GFA family protein [Pseudomonas sp.]
MKGSCACGATGYEIDRLDSPILHCHCTTCRKTHAAAYASTAGVQRAHFRWRHGQAVLRAFESSPGKLRHFCGQCGSHLVAERVGVDLLIVRVATLDDAPTATPDSHIWTEHDVPWLEDQGLPRYRQWQPGR